MAYLSFYASFLNFWQKIVKSFKNIWHYYPSRIYALIVLVFQLVIWWQSFVIYKGLEINDLLVLRYKIDFGANLISEPKSIFLYPVIALAVFFLDFIVLMLFSKHSRIKAMSQLLLASAAVFNFFMILYLVSVYLINFR